MKTNIKVLIVDDSAVVRKIFTQELSSMRGTSEFRNFGEASLEIQEIYSATAEKTNRLPVFSFLQFANRTLLGENRTFCSSSAPCG